MTRTLFVFILLTGFSPWTSAREVAAPVPAPYAPKRQLLATSSERMEWTDATRDRVVPIRIYYAAESEEPCPVILFSHGLGGTRDTYEYLGRQWAAHGYVSIHLQHPGSDDTAWRGQERPLQSMRQAANGQNAVDRARDVSFAIDQIESLNREHPKLKNKLNSNAIGVAGHSFGANTSLLVAGQQLGGGALAPRLPRLADDRVKAVIPMSAPVPVMRTNLAQVWGSIRIPVLLMTGTEDESPLNDTSARDRRLPFDHLNTSPAYLIIFNGGDHAVFSGRLVDRPNDARFQQYIRESSTAFWDAYLRQDEQARMWLHDGGLKDALGDAGTLEAK